MTVELYTERRREMGDQLKREARRASERWRSRIVSSVRVCREARKLTQAELGAAAGIDLMTVSKIERGIAAPDYATIETLADILRVPIDVLVGRLSPHEAVAQGLLEKEELEPFNSFSPMISAARMPRIEPPRLRRVEPPKEPLEDRVDRLEGELLESVERQSKMLAALQRLEAGKSASRRKRGKE